MNEWNCTISFDVMTFDIRLIFFNRKGRKGFSQSAQSKSNYEL